MGANVKPSTIMKAGKVRQVFKHETSHYRQFNYHAVPGFGKDMDAILKVLENEFLLWFLADNTKFLRVNVG